MCVAVHSSYCILLDRSDSPGARGRGPGGVCQCHWMSNSNKLNQHHNAACPLLDSFLAPGLPLPGVGGTLCPGACPPMTRTHGVHFTEENTEASRKKKILTGLCAWAPGPAVLAAPSHQAAATQGRQCRAVGTQVVMRHCHHIHEHFLRHGSFRSLDIFTAA